jgi:hypothetical protein
MPELWFDKDDKRARKERRVGGRVGGTSSVGDGDSGLGSGLRDDVREYLKVLPRAEEESTIGLDVAATSPCRCSQEMTKKTDLLRRLGKKKEIQLGVSGK